MSRDLIRAHGTIFRGISQTTEHSRANMRPITDFEWIVYFRDANNLWTAPGGRLTTRHTGWRLHAEAPENAYWQGLAFIARPDGYTALLGIQNGNIYKQENVAGDWVQIGTGLPTDGFIDIVPWHEYFFVFPPGQAPKRVTPTWDIFDLVIRAPQDTPLAEGQGTGSFSGTYKYWVTFYRSDDGWESPILETPAEVMVENVDKVHLSNIPSSSDPQVDKVRIWRTTDGGETPLLLDTIDNGVTTYDDQKSDTQLGIQCETVDCIDDFSGRVAWSYGERVYVGDVDEGVPAERYASRVRWCDPSAPWAWRALSFSDEIGGRIIAAVRFHGGAVIFTPEQGWGMTVVQGVLHVFQGLAIPGAVGRRAACAIPGGVAWIADGGVYTMTSGGEAVPIGMEIAPIIRGINVNNLDRSWIVWHQGWRSILVAYPDETDVPDRILVRQSTIHDTMGQASTGGEWWKMTWGGTVACQASSGSSAPDGVVVGLPDGRTAWALEGELPADRASFEIDETDFGIHNRKRFRDVFVSGEAVGGMEMAITSVVDGWYRVEEGARVGSDGATLDVDFFLDQSVMGGAAVFFLRNSASQVGRHLGLEFIQKQPAIMVIHGVTVTMQLGTRD